jgi:hypothetical protein
MTEQSETINALASALSKAQGQITGALKDSSNPFFKTKYADLASVWDACRDQLSANGLCVIQTLSNKEDQIVVTTTLAHSSGEWIRGELAVKPVKSDPQGIGSAITYARRYTLAAIVGVAQIDDDAEAAMGRKDTDKNKVSIDIKAQREFAEQARKCLSSGDVDGLKQLWSEWDADERIVLWAMFNSQERTAMKAMKGDA